MPPIAPQPSTKIHYGWVIVGITFLALLVTAGMRSSPTVLIVPLEEEFGWSRANISGAIAVQLMVYGLIGPFAAGLMERFGIRRMMGCGLLLIALGASPTIFITRSWQLLPLWGIATGIGTGTVSLVMSAIVANRWFVARRGLVIGLLTASAAGGQLIFLPLLANLTVYLGWRSAVITGCVITVAIIPVVLLLMRDWPSDKGLRPYGLPADAIETPRLPPANPFAAAFTALGRGIVTRDFWLLSGSFFVCGASTIGLIGTHFIPACADHGIPEAAAAGILAAMGVCNFIGTTGSGWLTDRFDSRYLLFWYYGLRGVSLLFLPYSFDFPVWGLTIFGLFYGLDWIATVPPTVRLAANCFGAQQAGMMYGWIMVVHQLGSAFAAFGGGLLRTYFGDYVSAFMISGVLCLLAAVIVLRIGKSPQQGSTKRPALAMAEA